MESRWRIAYAEACIAMMMGCTAYLFADGADWSRLTYFPESGQWRWTAPVSDPAPMSFVGIVVWGCFGLAAGWMLAWLLRPWLLRILSTPARFRLLGAWALTAFFVAGAHYVWSLWPIPR